MTDPYNLQRFIDAQDVALDTALAELQSGRKQSHWMWFVLPQLAELGRSPMAKFYGVASLDEARAYLNHSLLGPRLRECVEVILSWAERRSAEDILGAVDAMKLRSSLTLFDAAATNDIFARALNAFFRAPDERTLALLNGQR